MKLTQKAYPFGRTDIELGDDVVRVTTSHLLTTNGFEVPLRELRPHPSFHRTFPLLWLIFSIALGSVALVFLWGGISIPAKDQDARLGLFVATGVFVIATLLCVHGFFQRKVDYIILHYEHTGMPAIFLHRRLPTEKHVQEFVEIAKEHIQLARTL